MQLHLHVYYGLLQCSNYTWVLTKNWRAVYYLLNKLTIHFAYAVMLQSKLFVPVGLNFFVSTLVLVKSIGSIDNEFKFLILSTPPMNPVHTIEPF